MNTIIIKNSELLEPDLYQIQNKEIVNHIQKVLKLKYPFRQVHIFCLQCLHKHLKKISKK